MERPKPRRDRAALRRSLDAPLRRSLLRFGPFDMDLDLYAFAIALTVAPAMVISSIMGC